MAICIRDHKGKAYKSIRELAKDYGIPYHTLKKRLYKLNWGIQRALETPVEYRKVNTIKDHKGNEYKSIGQLAKAYGLSYNVLNSRLSSGWDIERALTTPVKEVHTGPIQDHEGKVYNSFKEMALNYGMEPSYLKKRLSRGWSLEKALTTPVKKRCINLIKNY